MTHHQHVNGNDDFSALDLHDFLIRDRERRGNPKPTLARKAERPVDPMELSRVMATDHSVPKLLDFSLINRVRYTLVALCVVGLIAVTYSYVYRLWH